MPNIGQLLFDSNTAGLAQTQAISFSLAIPSSSYTGGQAKTFTASTTMASSTGIPDIQAQLTGLSTKWFWLNPLASFDYPDGSTDATASFIITMKTYFTGTTLKVDVTLTENTFSANTSPAFTLTCQAYIDEAPF